jgi:hypothetical protein
MSKTRTFKIGHADVFQDKPSEETRLALEIMHKNQHHKANGLVDNSINDIAEAMKDKSEAELSIVLNVIVRETNRLKQENNPSK